MCLYDMVYGNKTDIDICSVTGDNHFLNKLNFVALGLIDVDQVPQYLIPRGLDFLSFAYRSCATRLVRVGPHQEPCT